MKAHLLCIGNEILIGDTINTNASYIAERLTRRGIHVETVVVVGDVQEAIVRALDDAVSRADLLILTGGLGPTDDDITREVVAAYAGAALQLNQEILDHIRSVFERRGIPFPPSNRKQALVPTVAEVLFNRAGTAPGLWLQLKGCYTAILPGVPSEMRYLMEHEVMPRVGDLLGSHDAYHAHYLHTFGISESQLHDEVMSGASALLADDVSLAFLPSLQGVTMRVSSYADTLTEARFQSLPLVNHLRARASAHIYSENDKPDHGATVVRLLAEKEVTLATAESCTGGLVAGSITAVPGSSHVFPGGVITYANEAKSRELGVPSHILETHGAVSAETAAAMAIGVARKFGTDIGISITGIAGPGGGSAEKPVGTVWFGFWCADTHFSCVAHLAGNRSSNRTRSVGIALELVRRHLMGVHELPFDMVRVAW